jgi:hypothetical protein
MDVPVNFKFDVRIRTRHLAKGVVTEAEVSKHLEALADAQGQIDVIDLAQPALATPEERQAAAIRPSAVVAKPSASVAGSSPPLSIPPAPSPVDEAWGDDDDDDDDDDDEVEGKPEGKPEGSPTEPKAGGE